MITVHILTPDATIGVDMLIHLMRQYREHLLRVVEVKRPIRHDRGSDYAFIAIFREPGTIGQLVAFVHPWATSWGPGSGGTGSSGFARMQSYIEDEGIEPERHEWWEIPEEFQSPISGDSIAEMRRGWSAFLEEFHLPYLFEYGVEYPLNEKWEELDRNWPSR